MGKEKGDGKVKKKAGASRRLTATMRPRKHIALVAHDNKKDDLVEWARYNRELLLNHSLYATGTTGRVLIEHLDLPVTRLQSGPLGGDQQLGALIVDGKVNCLIFFWDPLEAQPHDPDVRALLRIAAVWNIPVATNRATADFLITSPLMDSEYERLLTDYTDYHKRLLKAAADIDDKE
jgi:methylglyoxal synthase